LRIRFAVNKRNLPQRPCASEALGKGNELALVRVCAESVKDHNFGLQAMLFAKNANPWLLFRDAATKRILRLESKNVAMPLKESAV
jgi:hypothetical protein